MTTRVLSQQFASREIQQRVLTYWMTGIGLALSFVLLRGSAWQGSANLHTLMESIATVLAFIAGIMALVRYYSKKNNNFLIIGAGFTGTGFLDCYHGLVTSAWVKDYLPTELDSLIPWSGIAPRLFLAVLLYLSIVLCRREHRLGELGQVDERSVYVVTAGLTLISFLFFALVPLPSAYHVEMLFHRPHEFVPAMFFLLALIGYLDKDDWQQDAFSHWLVLSLIVNFIAQAVFMPFSDRLFNMEFDAAHVLKIVGYICVLIGLFINMYATFRQVEREVEERKRSEMARKETDIRYQMVINTMPDGLIIIDEQGLIESFNPGAELIFDYNFEEVRGKNVSLLMPEPYRSQHGAYIKRYLLTGESRVIGNHREIELEGQRKDGSRFPMGLSVTEMKIGNRRLFSGLLRDISERKSAEAQLHARERALERSNTELKKFAYVASHDLKEPLRKVQAFGDRLTLHCGSVLDDQGRDYLRRMQNAADRMRELIDGLLTFSRVSSHSKSFQSTNLSKVMDEVLTDLEVCITQTGAKVEVGELPAIEADPIQMRQIFQNLISNALKFHKPDTLPVIKVNAECFDETIKHGLTVPKCQISIADNGIGFEPQYAEKIFEVFQRLVGRDEYEGTGMGLAICRKIAERHGGSLTATGLPGVGANFLLTLRVFQGQ